MMNIKNFNKFITENIIRKQYYDIYDYSGIILKNNIRNEVNNFFNDKKIVTACRHMNEHIFLYNYMLDSFSSSKIIKEKVYDIWTYIFYDHPFKTVKKLRIAPSKLPIRYFLLKSDADKIIEDNKLNINLNKMGF